MHDPNRGTRYTMPESFVKAFLGVSTQDLLLIIAMILIYCRMSRKIKHFTGVLPLQGGVGRVRGLCDGGE
jgi:hypothetical protein